MDSDISKLLKDKNRGVKIDIGCGANKQEDFIGIDIRPLPGVDIVHDLETFPFPLPSECASLAVSSHVVEHINPHKGIFIDFMNEVWRLLKPRGKFLIATPYAGSTGFFQDPTHVNPCNENTWRYFDPLDDSQLWTIYKPKPWKIITNMWQSNGNMEIVLEKRKEDPSYKSNYKENTKFDLQS